MFRRKKKENDEDLKPLSESDNIKDRIGDVSNGNLRDIGMEIESPVPVPPKKDGTAAMDGPENIILPRRPLQKTHAPPARLEIPRQGEEHEHAAGKPAPPLFIKIDRYRELMQNISELKSYTLNIRDVLDALSDIEKELKNGLSVTQTALDKINNTISVLDSKLLRVGSEERRDLVEIPAEMDEYIKNLYDNIERVKHELRTLKE